VGALTCFGTLEPMVFDLRNGAPVITERSLSKSWKSPIAELIAFINGARTVDEIESYGCSPRFWGPYRGKGTEIGLDPDDLGPGSYGAVFHDYECADGRRLNQFAQVVDQITRFPQMRTHRVTNWRPDYTARGPHRRVQVAPCHGELHFRVMNGALHMRMDQRSGDFPIGVPHNMVQYSALLLMMCQVTGYRPGSYIHSFADAHIYENQLDAARVLVERAAQPFPVLRLDSTVKNLFDFRIEHFTLEEYYPHPAVTVPYSP
jgi:thymidylate synthase